MEKVECLDRACELSFQMEQLTQKMYEAGFTDDDIQQAVEDGAREYRILIGEEE